jgi:hypothetical protein
MTTPLLHHYYTVIIPLLQDLSKLLYCIGLMAILPLLQAKECLLKGATNFGKLITPPSGMMRPKKGTVYCYYLSILEQ